jgi:hypothetical protein
MILDILEFSVSGGFWRFIGVLIIISSILNLPIVLLRVIIKGINVNKHGDLACYKPAPKTDD